QGHYVVEKTNGLPKTFEGVSLKKDNPLIVYLNEIKEPVRLDELREQFYDQPGKEERGKLAEIIKELENLSSAVAVPSFVKNRLVGVLTLGEKLSEEPYNQEDIELISTMASEAGIAIENAKLYRDIVETKDYLNSIIQNSDDAIFTLDLDGTVLTWNSGAEKIFGRPPVFLSQSETQEFVGRISAGEEIKALEVGINTRERGRVDLLLSCSPIKGAEEKMIGASLILKDISGLKKVDQTKREFLSIVSHELRTPLTPIKGYVSILLQGNIGPLEPRQKNALETVLKNTNHLQDLIESIIDISRLEAGKPLETEKEPFFLEKMIKESVDNAAPSFTAKGIGLSFDHHDGDIAVIGDRKKITQVMDNLLGNSLKFTPAGGAVKVTMNREEGGVRITVSDTGIGLDGKNLFKIFERFFQVDSSYTRATGGIGMGLAIAKEVVEAHGGRIWAESEGPGHGSKFIFTLPLS
ncbi:MAG: PAS domain S-box protein, partial [Candidatus Margulisbacteria bacterium]|nr:PAS domain S-box protein [Candidatus Margulisiibacteriota bacterium]